MSHRNLNEWVRQAHETNNYDPLLQMVPYARLIGIECLRLGDEMVFRLPSSQDNIGNPTLPALHGGVIAGFMEHAAMLHLLMFMGAPHLPKIIDFSIDYLRAGLYRDTFAACQVWRQGRRVANVAVTAWQTNQSEPIATARCHFKVDEP
nr:PaaI family thioesterase [Pseudomonas sp.]